MIGKLVNAIHGIRPIFVPNPSTVNWMDTCDLSSRERQDNYQEIDSPFIFDFALPKTLSTTGEEVLFSWCRRFRNTHRFVVKLPGGGYISNPSSVVTHDRTILTELSPLIPFNTKHYQHPLTKRIRLPKPTNIEGTALLLSSYFSSGNYYHWMFDLLPRIELFKRSWFSETPIDHVIVNRAKVSYEMETLEYAGFNLEDCIESDRFSHIRATNLVVPSYPSRIGFPLRRSAEYLNGLVPNEIQVSSPEYIILDRSDAQSRRLEFDPEMIAALEEMGFQQVLLSNRSVKEQATLFRNAKIIIASHGAGLANLAFSKPGTLLIEIFPPGFENCIYWYLASQLGIRYQALQVHSDEVTDNLGVILKFGQSGRVLLDFLEIEI